MPSDLRIIQLSIEKQSLHTSDIEFPGKIKTYYMLDKKIIRQKNVLVDYVNPTSVCFLKKDFLIVLKKNKGFHRVAYFSILGSHSVGRKQELQQAVKALCFVFFP